MNRRKLVIVGDAAVGKSSLLIVFARGESPIPLQAYVPTVLNVVDIDVNGEPIQLTLQDTCTRQELADRLRPLCYPESHAFLICFSIACPDTLENVLEKWDTEIKHFGAGMVPRFLVGCKKDLRYDIRALLELSRYSLAPVTTQQGRDMARVIGAEYFECSSKTGEGVRELFARVTESMDADRVAQYKDKRLNYHRPWYRNGGCIVA